MPVHKILLKYPSELSTEQLIKALELDQNNAIVCHIIEHDHHSKKDENNKNNKKKQQDFIDKNDNNIDDREEVSSLMVELTTARCNEWSKRKAESANAEAIHLAIGDVPHANIDHLTSAEITLLLQNHIHEIVFGMIDKKFGFDALLGADSTQAQHDKRKENREKHEDLISLVELLPIHDEKEKLERFSWFSRISVEKYQSYYGDAPAFYNAWMKFYVQFLSFPSIFGLGIFLMNCYTGDTVNDNPLVPLFSILIIFWAILFVKFWDRRAATLACKFRSTYAKDVEVIRPQFRGEYKFNSATGRYEKFFPYAERVKFQIISVIVTILMLIVALFVQVCSLNLQGYMRGKHPLLEIEFLADFADPGAIFDPESNWSMIPVVGHSVIIMILNEIYKHFATELTELENYKTRTEFENAMIVKRCCFEFCDTYAALFYVAFYRLDILQLRQELLSLYMVDQFRRVAVETLIPFVQSFLSKKISNNNKKKSDLGKKKKNDGDDNNDVQSLESQKELNATLAEEAEALAEYESFDDYMEIILGQFGYVTLFASAFPLAGICSLLSNLVEIRSDLFKTTFLTRRPLVVPTNNIGPWRIILKLFAYFSVITNSLLFGFTSDQMRFYFPQFFDLATDEPKPGYGKFVVSIIFIAEHLLFFLVLLIDFAIPDVPESVQLEMQARKIKFVNSPTSLYPRVVRNDDDDNLKQ